MRYFLFIALLFLLLKPEAKAQNVQKTNWSLSTGFVTTVDPYEDGQGFHLGANLYKANVDRLAWDTQVSVNYTSNFEDAFSINILGGGRIYFNKSDNKNRYFFNLLAGPSLFTASGDDYITTVIRIGYSGGFYANFKRFLIGAGIERHEVVAFKLGYTF